MIFFNRSYIAWPFLYLSSRMVKEIKIYPFSTQLNGKFSLFNENAAVPYVGIQFMVANLHSATAFREMFQFYFAYLITAFR